jgi:hypothetical protein
MHFPIRALVEESQRELFVLEEGLGFDGGGVVVEILRRFWRHWSKGRREEEALRKGREGDSRVFMSLVG